MQAKAIAFKEVSFITNPSHPALNIWQSLYYELIEAGYDKNQIALWVNLSPRSIDRLLTGDTKQPSFKVLASLLHAYCCHSLQDGQ